MNRHAAPHLHGRISMEVRRHAVARLPRAREDKRLPPYGFNFNVDIIEMKPARPRTDGAGTGFRPQGYGLSGKGPWTVLIPVIRAASPAVSRTERRAPPR